MAQVLVIEDNETIREGISQILQRMGHTARGAANGLEGLKLFTQSRPDFVITDLKMDGLDGIEVLRRIKELAPDAIVMVLTAAGTVEAAVEAMKLGAFDFITKPISYDFLRMKVTSAIDVAKMRAENRYLRSELDRSFPETLLGSSAAFRKIKEAIQKVASTESTILLRGEGGTGKELIARTIHAKSRRSAKSFIRINCSGLSERALELQLFGHEREVVPEDSSQKTGLLELADGGTVMFDEVSDVAPSLQQRLGRFFQDRTFERIGSSNLLKSDVRIIVSTRKDLEREVREGRLREDLYHRIQIVPIDVPPLRERLDDFPQLAEFFLKKLAEKTGRQIEIDPPAMALLRLYSWPGNIRELKNTMERFSVLAPENRVRIEDLPSHIKNMSTSR